MTITDCERKTKQSKTKNNMWMAMVHADIPFICISQESTSKPHSAETLRAAAFGDLWGLWFSQIRLFEMQGRVPGSCAHCPTASAPGRSLTTTAFHLNKQSTSVIWPNNRIVFKHNKIKFIYSENIPAIFSRRDKHKTLPPFLQCR